MFPLGTVLFPTMPLSMHIFEPRYRVLVHDCLKAGGEFGVVLIERGHEVGGGDERFGVATVARIREAGEYPDGRWDISTTGGRRVGIVTWLPDDPYPVALVAERPDIGDDLLTADDVVPAERAVRRALALLEELGELPRAPSNFVLPPDPRSAMWQLAVIAPLSALDQLGLLEADDARPRLRLLADLVTEASDVLAYRLSGR
jgi:Lon protease-like protein